MKDGNGKTFKRDDVCIHITGDILLFLYAWPFGTDMVVCDSEDGPIFVLCENLEIIGDVRPI